MNCLSVERQEDYEQTSELLASNSPKLLSKNGLAILNLEISNVRTSIGGKLIIELTSAQAAKGKQKNDGKDGSIIETGDFKTGDIARLDRYSSNGSKQKKVKKLANSSKTEDQEEAKEEAIDVDGVVISISEKRVNLAINIDHTTLQGTRLEEKVYQLYGSAIRVWIVKLSNEITYNRMESTMRKLDELTDSSTSGIMRLLLGQSQFVASSHYKVDQFFNTKLNEAQKQAIQFSISNNLSIIHGPPGTGKTSTIVELVKQLLVARRNNKRILICGPSNISVDTILERLSSFFVDQSNKLVRIGHPARILPQILKHSLDLIVEEDSRDVIKGIMKDIDKLTRKIKKAKQYKERRELYQEMKDLKKDLRARTHKGFSDALLRSDVVVATLHGSSSRELVSCIRENCPDGLFDTLIIDEVSQSLEPSCWIPLIYHRSINKLIIAGDNKQLSPTIKTKKNKRVVDTLSTTLFDRLLKVQRNHHEFTCFLNVQYRMNQKIMGYPSDALYSGKLVADRSVKYGKVIDLIENGDKDCKDNDDLVEPIIWYDTEGGDFPEMDYDSVNASASSKYNDGECLVVLKHAKELLSKGIAQEEIGIITPYSAQVTKLRQLFRSGTLQEDQNSDRYLDEPLNGIEISTVDGFQGREKEIIILSLVRSNDKRRVGFLSDEKRLNVSITRCKKQLCVVGDFETIGNSGVKFLKNWCKWCEDNDVDIRYVDLGEL
ncbi:hypothetical protein FOA43_003112 [Brettanomyces nanus]|uniref:AAA+ ATPase domain-containing protein n=1 Tax=Eeniella nana TaxID=13502 RepID=A0A875S6Z6_EENNA|nr:uncharacterized protein FOA43_003112 [Brettanomyces nanus]QPG75752.1 hypothetical protein FOA43_003112 [Brettanomyces nanus]